MNRQFYFASILFLLVIRCFAGDKSNICRSSLEAEVSQEWIDLQTARTEEVLIGDPHFSEVHTRIAAIMNHDLFTDVPRRGPGGFFFMMRPAGAQQSNIYRSKTLIDSPEVVVDMNQRSKSGDTAISSFSISPNGRFLAYSTTENGSDWATVQILDLTTGEYLVDQIDWTKLSSISWLPDSSGFFYSRYPRPQYLLSELSQFNTIHFHKIRSTQDQDLLVWDNPTDPDLMLGSQVIGNGRFLLITMSRNASVNQKVIIKSLTSHSNFSRGAESTIVGHFNSSFSYLGEVQNWLFFKTNHDAPNSRIVAINLRHPSPSSWRDVIAESELPIHAVSYLGDRFVVTYLQNGKPLVKMFTTEGRDLGIIPLPDFGNPSGFRYSDTTEEILFTFMSFTQRPTLYRYNLKLKSLEALKGDTEPSSFSEFETHQDFFTGADGTRIPLTICHKKGLIRNGQNPTLIYGYGGFGSSQLPSFNAGHLAFLQYGGIIALPALRGGLEYGENWHIAGTKKGKWNTFIDVVTAAQHLISKNYTSSSKLALSGRSNGGLMVGAVITQHPDLFQAAVAEVGVYDMLNFHRYTFGPHWTQEYGSPADPTEADILQAYSPLHNVKANTNYPAILLLTGSDDDRVVPQHTYRFAAALQEAQTGDRPILMRVDQNTGHGIGFAKPTMKLVDTLALQITFLMKQLNQSFADQ